MPWWVPLMETLWILDSAIIPISLTLAVLHYRLYDIDLIINRTLVYGTLTACTRALYVFVVGFLGNQLGSGDRSPIAFLTTGVVAVLFQPVRQRLQRAVNHFMYGERDEPFDVLARLGKRLQSTLAQEMVYPTIEVSAPLPSLPAAVEVAAYRIVQEALKNAAVHGHAENCIVHLVIGNGLHLTIADDGLGLPETITPGVGLLSMREPAVELGATFAIDSRPKGGPKIQVYLSC